MVWNGIFLNSHFILYLCLEGILTAVRYQKEILASYVTSYTDDICDELKLMDDNARPPQNRLVGNCLEDQSLPQRK